MLTAPGVDLPDWLMRWNTYEGKRGIEYSDVEVI